MYFIGIDISKFKHDCAVIDDSGEIITPSWSFTNDSEGFSQLKTFINSLDAETRIGLESTGHFSDSAQSRKPMKIWLYQLNGYLFIP